MNESIILSFVERGWQAAREWSMQSRPPGVRVIHLIKGSMKSEVRAFIRPIPGVELVAIPRKVFWPMAFILFVWYASWRRLQAVLVDNDRSHHRLRLWSRWIPTDIMQVS